MPSRFSSEGSLRDAAKLAANLGCDHRVIEIEAAHAAFLDMLAPSFGDRDVDVEVNGKRFAVSMWVPESQLSAPSSTGGNTRRARPRRQAGGGTTADSGTLTVPMQGTIVKVHVDAGDPVAG